jgi:hypothetical protein
MKDALFTNEAQKVLFRVLISCCHPLVRMTVGRKKHEDRLLAVVKQGKDINLSEYLNHFEFKPVMYRKLLKSASRIKKRVIDPEVVLSYFGGKLHISKITRDIAGLENEGLSEQILKEFLLLHLLMFVEVQSVQAVNGRLSVTGIYENDGKKVVISDLAVFKADESKIKVGDHVFSHFAMVVKPEADKKLSSRILFEQARDEEFAALLREMNGKTINSRNLFTLTSKAMDEYGF